MSGTGGQDHDAKLGARGPAARLTGITKRFGATLALDDASLDIGFGQVHAVVGENGAGKSTLMKTLAGLVRPDAGEIEVGGNATVLHNARDAMRLGIGIVHQSPTLVEELTVAENYVLGHPRWGIRMRLNDAEQLVTATGQALGLIVNPRAQVARLSMGERQRAEIVAAVSYGARILILDEPTAALSKREFDIIEPVVKRLASEGRAIVYVSHKLAEVLAIGDRLTVMRRGHVVADHPRGEVGATVLVEEMIGRAPPAITRRQSVPGHVAIEFVHVSTAESGGHRTSLHDVGLSVRRGEITGVAAIAGNGEKELVELMVGTTQPTAGTIIRRATRTAFIPDDRLGRGLAGTMTVAENAIVLRHRRLTRSGLLDRRQVNEYTRTIVDAYRVVSPGPGFKVSSLSGGNQQKLRLRTM